MTESQKVSLTIVLFIGLVLSVLLNLHFLSLGDRSVIKTDTGCANNLTLCFDRVDRYVDMLDECQEMATYAQDHWQMWMDEAAACYGVSE